jgi:hypothetical protein
MRESFEVMSEHPYLTVFLSFVFLIFVSEILKVFKK